LDNPTILINHLLVGFAAVVLVAEITSLRLIYLVRRALAGDDGDHLLKLMFRFMLGVTLAQGLTLMNAVLRFNAFISDIRLVLFLAVQVVFAMMLIWILWEIRNLPIDR
jgi:hypothetical protein